MATIDHPHTCPSIDKKLVELNNMIGKKVSDLKNGLDECTEEEEVEDLLQELHDNIYNEAEGIIEEVRKTNEELRKSAESQIEELKKDKVEH